MIVLSGSAFADAALPADLIRIPPSIPTVFVAETGRALFHRYDNLNGELKLTDSHYMSIGEAGAGKEKDGDKRTPLGVYIVTEELDTTRLHEKYGARAFPLDYPNAWDSRAGRDGDGIWVHGVDRRGGQRPQLDTDGCIALPNSVINRLSPLFLDNVTPVVVVTEAGEVDDAKRDRLDAALVAVISEWANSIASADLHGYLSLYDATFRRWGLDKTQWSALSLQSIGATPRLRIEIDELLLIAYPEVEGLYFSRFRQSTYRQTANGETKTSAMKRLFWHRNTHGEFKIVAEGDG